MHITTIELTLNAGSYERTLHVITRHGWFNL